MIQQWCNKNFVKKYIVNTKCIINVNCKINEAKKNKEEVAVQGGITGQSLNDSKTKVLYHIIYLEYNTPFPYIHCKC